MANFCKNCGSKLNPGARFCPKCGQAVSPTTGMDDKRNVGNTSQSVPPDTYGGPIYSDPVRRGPQPHSGKNKGQHNIMNIVLASVLFFEIILVCFWHPGLLLFGKKSSDLDHETTVAQIDVPVVVDSMRSNTLKLDEISVSFGDNETGDAVLIPDLSDTSESGDTQVYNLAFTEIPKDPVTVEMEVPEPTGGEAYLWQLGIPVRDNKGNEYIESVPLKTQWEGGKAKASVSLDDVDGYLSGINYEAAGEIGAVCVNRIEEFVKDITLINTISTGYSRLGDVSGAYIGAIKLCFTKEQLILSPNGRFLLHISEDDFDSTETNPKMVHRSDAENYGADMEEIYKYYASHYNVSKRTYWPMDVYFKHVGSGLIRKIGLDYIGLDGINNVVDPIYVASFNMPSASLGGRLGYGSINDAYMNIDVDYLKSGYRRKKTEFTAKDGTARKISNLNIYVTKLYGAFAHEMFHFVQRCYVDNGGTQRWFDESSAAYFDSFFTENIRDLKLEENYEKEWQEQFSVMTNNPTSFGKQYGRMPVFCYMMKRNGDSLKLAYKYLEDNGGYTGWKDVFEYAMGTTMAPFVRAYFQELVTKGTLYSKYNTPWEIYEGPIGTGEKQSKIDTAAWKELRYTEIINNREHTGEEQTNSEWTGKYALPAYGARFVILDTSKLPEMPILLNVALNTPSVDGTIYRIKGDSYDQVEHSIIPSEKDAAMSIEKDEKILLMLVNESGSDCDCDVTYKIEGDITPFLGQYSSSENETARIIIRENYIRLPNSGVNQLYFDSYDIDGNTLTVHFRNTDISEYTMTLLGDDRILWEAKSTGYKQVWNRVPKGQEYEEWGELYTH